MTEVIVWLVAQLVTMLIVKLWIKDWTTKLLISLWVCVILWVWSYILFTYFGEYIDDIKVFLAWSFWWMQIFYQWMVRTGLIKKENK